MRTLPPNFRDLSGRRFGRLTVQEYVTPEPGRRGARWICLCDCGVRCEIEAHHLVSGKTRSCGCYRKEFASGNTPRAHAVWRIPVTVLADGVTHRFASVTEAAGWIGCVPSTVAKHIYTGKPFRNFSIQTNNPKI